ncbi:MAG: winged helix-turn-helix transcriptional regulator [Propionibacteriaceae bacterium]|jgi:ATP-dependent DNA helicase RecG|nr:winged helix-turn-helix transcriptional regulator [Propionibacteriaceae bacterium]
MREAVLNAIVHRDYSTGVPIQIKILPDEVIIYNDGGLPEEWTLADLLGQHRSQPRNAAIANAFFRSGQIETWGRGIEKIEEACRAEGRPLPVFQAKSREVSVSFPILASGQTSSPHGDGRGDDNDELTNTERVLAAVAAAPAATQPQLSKTTGLSPRTVSREIQKLRDAGFILRVG